MRRHDGARRVLKPITTFDQRIEAAKIVSHAIADGLLDDLGETAEITPQQFALEGGKIVGVLVTILAPAGASIRASRDNDSRRFMRRGKAMLETTAFIPNEAA